MLLGSVNLFLKRKARRFYRTNLGKSFSCSTAAHWRCGDDAGREVSIIKLSTILLCGCVFTFALALSLEFVTTVWKRAKFAVDNQIKLNAVQSVCISSHHQSGLSNGGTEQSNSTRSSYKCLTDFNFPNHHGLKTCGIYFVHSLPSHQILSDCRLPTNFSASSQDASVVYLITRQTGYSLDSWTRDLFGLPRRKPQLFRPSAP